MDGRHIEIRGTVQGVGFRPFVYQVARRSGIAGNVRNDSGGVVIDAFGSPAALDEFIEQLEREAPPAAQVRSIEWSLIPYREENEFTIAASDGAGEHRVSIPADLATCDDCRHEILDPSDRRYRYPFTNCTNCGPRYTIVTGAPYDRPKTSMAAFAMCPECLREYEDPLNRRFHAQPNACPACGPRLRAVTVKGQEISTPDPINFAARALRSGLIVALKGVGGYHLACDARSASAVRRLRERKHREAKPLAVMVADLDAASAIAELTQEEQHLLTTIERPIVLARRRADGGLAADISPGIPLVGVFLPYTPLHHLLLGDAAIPLVMTSGNISEEPMVTDDEEALRQLADVADLFLVHDRPIVARADDSVSRIIDGGPTVLRRGRGYVPRAIVAKHSFAQPILACGAHLKNTFCIASGAQAFLGPHIGDLETAETLRQYELAIERMKTFVGVHPRVIAHDMHSEYFSTRYAQAQRRARTIAVQHHHAHIASVMAEHGLDGQVIGVAYDGTGFGTDGTLWGGEILVARYAGFERFATFRSIALPGGEQAIRQPWRIALALLNDAYAGEPPLGALPLFRELPQMAIETARRMIERRLNTPLARGVGRYFDAFGALFLVVPDAAYEGEVALRWNEAADGAEQSEYPIAIRESSGPWEIDLRATVRAAVDDFRAGRSAATISARFHNTLAAATAAAVRAALADRGAMPVVLSGGCFQNVRLAESTLAALRPHARVFMNRNIPPGDGGIALGQAFVAGARLRREEAACA
jgi:hydrogenase maturation protein HypF